MLNCCTETVFIGFLLPEPEPLFCQLLRLVITVTNVEPTAILPHTSINTSTWHINGIRWEKVICHTWWGLLALFIFYSELSSKWLFLCWLRLALLWAIRPYGLTNLFQSSCFWFSWLKENSLWNFSMRVWGGWAHLWSRMQWRGVSACKGEE